MQWLFIPVVALASVVFLSGYSALIKQGTTVYQNGNKSFECSFIGMNGLYEVSFWEHGLTITRKGCPFLHKM